MRNTNSCKDCPVHSSPKVTRHSSNCSILVDKLLQNNVMFLSSAFPFCKTQIHHNSSCCLYANND